MAVKYELEDKVELCGYQPLEYVTHHSQIHNQADLYRHNKRTRKQRWRDESSYVEDLKEDRWR